MINISVTEHDAKRILTSLYKRRRELDRAVAKFGVSFDPELGRNITESLADYNRIIPIVEGAING